METNEHYEDTPMASYLRSLLGDQPLVDLAIVDDNHGGISATYSRTKASQAVMDHSGDHSHDLDVSFSSLPELSRWDSLPRHEHLSSSSRRGSSTSSVDAPLRRPRRRVSMDMQSTAGDQSEDEMDDSTISEEQEMLAKLVSPPRMPRRQESGAQYDCTSAFYEDLNTPTDSCSSSFSSSSSSSMSEGTPIDGLKDLFIRRRRHQDGGDVFRAIPAIHGTVFSLDQTLHGDTDAFSRNTGPRQGELPFVKLHPRKMTSDFGRCGDLQADNGNVTVGGLPGLKSMQRDTLDLITAKKAEAMKVLEPKGKRAMVIRDPEQ